MQPRPTRRALGAAGLAALGATLIPGAARAQGNWPDRPVRIIVPFPPGQAADLFTRLVADDLGRRWPQRTVVENRAGGAGVPAMDAGARSAPDGYTLIAGSSGTLGVNPSLIPNLTYDAERDFAAISNVVVVPLLIVAHPSFPADTVQQMVEQARANPGKIDLATAGPGTSQHLAGELFAHRAGIKLNMVHYRGSGPASADLVGGHIKVMVDSVASALPHIRAGRLKALALTTAQRVPQLPDVPTIAETVVPGYQAVGWSGLVAPAGTPPEILERINADVGKALRDPAIAKRIEDMGAIATPTSREEFSAFISSEIAKWREVVKLANVRLDG
jgi:tripartite-type tricarboxylate transporter receptor subunit TctC